MQVADMTEADLYTTYKGVYVPNLVHSTESLKYYEEFSFRPDDILIVTYPKSGKTFPGRSVEVNSELWMQQIIIIHCFAKWVLKYSSM